MDMSQIVAEAAQKVEQGQVSTEETPVEPETQQEQVLTEETPQEPETPAEEPTAETPAEETPAEPEKQDFDPKFEVLKRREKALREREQQVKELEKQQKQFDTDQELAQKDPLAYLEKMGLSYEKLTDAMLGNNPADKPEAKMDQLEQRLQKFEESDRQRAEEAKQKESQQQIEEYTQLLTKHIDTSEKYELIKATASQKLVMDTIVEHFNQTQEELDWDIASDVVEDYLWKTEVEKIKNVLKIDKIRKEIGLDSQPEDVSDKEVKPSASKTLSNSNTSAVPERHQAGKPMTFKEALERAKKLEAELFNK